MLKQKTVAKWLAIVLLLTVAVGSYLLYDAVFKNADGTADAVEKTDDVPADSEVPQPTPPHVPFYTTLPRKAETINGVTVSHVGGESGDFFKGAVAVGNVNFVFFNSDSVEYDLREKGLHLAFFKDDELQFVDKISDGEYLDSKLSEKGVALATKESENLTLSVFSLSGELSAKTALPYADDFSFYLHGNSLTSFSLADGYLHFSEYLDSVKEQRSPYVAKTKGTSIDNVLFSGGKYLVITSSDENVYGYSFELNSGFSTEFSFDKLSLLQIESVGGLTDSKLTLLLKGEKGLVLSTMSNDFSLQDRKAIDGVSSGVIIGNGDGFDLVASGKTLTFCKHLDLISTAENPLVFDDVSAFLRSKNSLIFIAKNGDDFSLLSTENGVLATLPESVISPLILPAQSGVKILFSSSTSSGITRASFGGFDVYSCTYQT